MAKRILLAFFLVFILSGRGDARNDTETFNEAIRLAYAGKTDQAFIHFHSLAARGRASAYFEEALFAGGEYYYALGEYAAAYDAFYAFAENFPRSKAAPFILVYALKIAEHFHEHALAASIKKQLTGDRKVEPAVSEAHKLNYLSPLGRKYALFFFADRLECYLDERLFLRLGY